MKTTYNIVIDSISSVTGGWDSGFSVDVNIHREPVDGGSRDGFETVRVHLDRDRLVKADGSYDMDAVTTMVVEKVGEVEEVDDWRCQVTASNHTPGPWTLMQVGATIDLKGNNGNRLLATWDVSSDGIAAPFNDEDAANLRLIAESPAMLKALEAILATADFRSTDMSADLGERLIEIEEIARAAIAKAKGQP